MAAMHRRRAPRASSLVEILLFLVVIAVVFFYLLPRYLPMPVRDAGAAAGVVQDSRDAVCRANLGVVRSAIALRRMNGGAVRYLSDLNLQASQTHCIVGGEEYVFYPDAGDVRCPHGGHEGF